MKKSGIIAIIILFFVTVVFIYRDEILVNFERPQSELEIARKVKAMRDSIAEVRKNEIIEREANRSHWRQGTFVDSFGDPTGNKYIETTTEGVFSNSATRNSYLYVKILVTKNNAGIFLHEYDRDSSPASFFTRATVMLKNSSDETLRITSNRKWSQIGGLQIYRNEYSPGFANFRNFLLNSTGEIKFVIEDEYSSRYNFTINTKGFKEEFQSL